jgi:hypothetical protein
MVAQKMKSVYVAAVNGEIRVFEDLETVSAYASSLFEIIDIRYRLYVSGLWIPCQEYEARVWEFVGEDNIVLVYLKPIETEVPTARLVMHCLSTGDYRADTGEQLIRLRVNNINAAYGHLSDFVQWWYFFAEDGSFNGRNRCIKELVDAHNLVLVGGEER